MSEPLVIRDSVVILARDLTWSATRASGPGGQNVNKVASKVELRFDIEASTLDYGVKSRLRAIAATKLDREGRIVIVSQITRDQTRNLEDAREKLRALVLAALTPPKRRRATKPSRGAKEKRLRSKQHQSDKKRERTSRSD